ncbi:MAG: TIGR00159 family protein [Leptospiraceae bacterium]|nr:diadenylate cyclase CdaA [Leptospiraceae bacterium]MCP5497843.1 TIGR00159 family protein [Leptospiraceae bacterium]
MEFIKTFKYLEYNLSLIPVVIDILIVSFVIYKIIMMLRKSRGIYLISGVGIIWVLGVVSKYYELELMDWIITNIRPSLLFIIVVILQPELRRIFGDIASMKFFKKMLYNPTFDIDEIIKAVKIMAEEKTGSLIVISKEISMKDIIEQSVQLDAIISSSLLLTIFKKNSALHDGAVIIEQNRIASAASYLPMSSALGTSTLGARHRSALGVAEETDAVVVVTSEETGEISVCHSEDMVHPVKPLELKNLLLSYLTNKETKKSTEKKEETETVAVSK